MKRLLICILIFCYNTVIASEVNMIYKKVTITAYSSEESQTDSTPFITATGKRCQYGIIACNFLPIGTKVWIKGFGRRPFIVEDRMNKRYNSRIDIWMSSKDDALKFGKRKLLIAHVIKRGGKK